jgi:hypothetical protein
MKKVKAKSKAKTTNQKLNTLLEKLPQSKVQELLDFADFLVSRLQTQKKVQRLGDRFAGIWQDDRTAEEIIADIRNSRINTNGREELRLESWK